VQPPAHNTTARAVHFKRSAMQLVYPALSLQIFKHMFSYTDSILVLQLPAC
jgi:hypothetical protein